MRGIWGTFVVGVLLVAGMGGWARLQWSAAKFDTSVGQSLAALLVAAAIIDLALAFWFYRTHWLPLCESSLKRLWAGRLVNGTEAQRITRTLLARGIVVMALAASPALYGLVLGLLGAGSTQTLGALAGASVVGLGAFYHYGLQPAFGIFEHAERIARG